MLFRPLAALFLFLGADLLLLALFPALRLIVDPLLLLLIGLSSGLRSSRSLWLLGFGLGLLKDLYAGTLFGAWSCAFLAAAWMIGATRRMIEWEDPAVVGVWTALLTLVVWIFHGFWLTLADPFLHWGSGRMMVLPAAMAIQGGLAAWLFPRMSKLFGRPSPGYRF